MSRVIYYTTCPEGYDHHTTETLDHLFAKVPPRKNAAFEFPEQNLRAVSILGSVVDTQICWYESVKGELTFPRSELSRMIDRFNLN